MGAYVCVCVCVCASVGMYVCVRYKDMFVHVQASVGYVCSAKVMYVQVWTCMQVDAWL